MDESTYKLMFFGKRDLIGYLYYYYLPKQIHPHKQELSNKITKLKGSISLCPRKQSIIIIENSNDLNSPDFKENFPFDIKNILLYEPNPNKTIFIEKYNEKIRCIKLKDLLSVINSFEKTEIQYEKLIKYGLPNNSNKDAIIAILNNNYIKKKTIYYEFPYIKKEYIKLNKSIYDIPMFFKHIASGFSQFCTLSEKKLVEKYYTLSINEDSKKTNNEDDIKQVPQPLKEHLYCHLCRTIFISYFEHIHSQIHKENLVKNQHVFNQIKNSFKRIRQFWKGKDKYKTMQNCLIPLTRANENKNNYEHNCCGISIETTGLTNQAECIYGHIKQTNNNCVKIDYSFKESHKKRKLVKKRKHYQFLNDHSLSTKKPNNYPNLINAYINKFIRK